MSDFFVQAFDSPFQLTCAIVQLAVCVYAVRAGGGPERLSGVTFAAAYLTSILGQNRSDWLWPVSSVLTVDVMMLAYLLVLAFRTDRWWVLFAAGFQLLGVLTHAAVALDQGVGGWAYWSVVNLYGAFVFAALAVGTWSVRPLRPAARLSHSAAEGRRT